MIEFPTWIANIFVIVGLLGTWLICGYFVKYKGADGFCMAIVLSFPFFIAAAVIWIIWQGVKFV